MSSAGGFIGPEPLDASHVVRGFDCGRTELDDWLVRHALRNQRADGARTRVVCRDGRVVGFYTLAAGSVAPQLAPERIGKGLARHPIPVVVLGRLAVDRSVQGKGLGAALLKDVMLKVLEISEELGVRALVVHAKDDHAKAWYLRHARFISSLEQPLHLFLLLKDMRATLASALNSATVGA